MKQGIFKDSIVPLYEQATSTSLKDLPLHEAYYKLRQFYMPIAMRNANTIISLFNKKEYSLFQEYATQYIYLREPGRIFEGKDIDDTTKVRAALLLSFFNYASPTDPESIPRVLKSVITFPRDEKGNVALSSDTITLIQEALKTVEDSVATDDYSIDKQTRDELAKNIDALLTVKPVLPQNIRLALIQFWWKALVSPTLMRKEFTFDSRVQEVSDSAKIALYLSSIEADTAYQLIESTYTTFSTIIQNHTNLRMFDIMPSQEFTLAFVKIASTRTTYHKPTVESICRALSLDQWKLRFQDACAQYWSLAEMPVGMITAATSSTLDRPQQSSSMSTITIDRDEHLKTNNQ